MPQNRTISPLSCASPTSRRTVSLCVSPTFHVSPNSLYHAAWAVSATSFVSALFVVSESRGASRNMSRVGERAETSGSTSACVVIMTVIAENVVVCVVVECVVR